MDAISVSRLTREIARILRNSSSEHRGTDRKTYDGGVGATGVENTSQVGHRRAVSSFALNAHSVPND